MPQSDTNQSSHPSGALNPSMPAKVEFVATPEPAVYAAGSHYDLESEDHAKPQGLLEYWRIIWRHKKAILLSASIGLLLGILIGIPMKPVYRASSLVEVLNLNEDFMNMKQSDPVTTADSNYEISEEQTQAKLLESDALLQSVMTKLDPNAPVPRLATSGWRSWFHLKEHVELTDREKNLDKLENSLKIRPTARTRVIEVTADAKDPQLAVDFVNTLLSEFIQKSVDARMNSGQSTSDWLRRQIDEARANLEKSEDALDRYAKNSGLIFTNDDTNVETEKLQTVEQQLSAATADRIAKQSHYELAKNSPPDSLGDVISDDGLRDMIAKISDLRSQIASMSAVFNPGYSKLKEAQAQLAILQAAFQTQRADILKHVEDDYTEALNKEKLLAKAYDAQVADVTGQGEKLVQYNILKREAESSRQLYDTMLQQTKQASLAAAMRSSTVRIVDPAIVPDLPIFPNFPLNAGLGLFAGLLFGIVFSTVKERSDRTLQEPGDIRSLVGLTELGAIPAASFLKIPRSRSAAALVEADVAQALSLNRSPFELVTLSQRGSIAAEAFRSILTSILFIGQNGRASRTFVFTSPNSEDGKTSAVSNLALAAGEIRRKVLIIDADLRRPRMHEIFALKNDRGLSDILRDEISPASLSGLIQETAIEGLNVLTAGGTTEAAAHLLYSPNFKTLLNGLRSVYDLIFIDTPPMLHMTDARVAGALADGVVLVARAGYTTRDSVAQARARLAEDRINVLGTILNDWDPRNSRAGYYDVYSRYKSYATKGARS